MLPRRASASLGFIWSLDKKMLEIPPPKKKKIFQKLLPWSVEQGITRKEVESTARSLEHCALAVPQAHSHISGIIRFHSTFASNDDSQKQKPSRQAMGDIKWWRNEMAKDLCDSTISPNLPELPIQVYVDACTSWGIAVVINKKYDCWQLNDGWKSEGRDIAWAEAVAIALAVEAVRSYGIRGRSITIHSDNQIVIEAFGKGSGGSRQVNEVLQHISTCLGNSGSTISLRYVESARNIADAPSRGQACRDMSRKNLVGNIPLHLRPFLTRAA